MQKRAPQCCANSIYTCLKSLKLQPNRTVVKTDTEAAIKGKQWPLSSYGPFKDKASLPNFEDQSFEEIRALCYEAKNAGNLQSLLPKLSQQAADASYKMSTLCDVNNVNNNMLNMLVNLYNSGESTATNQTSLSSGNQFAISVSGGQPNTLFGNSTTTQQNPFGSSVFATTTATPSSNIFGGGTSTNSFFGQSTNTFGGGGNSASVFGGQSAFGGTTSNANAFGGTTAFGQSNPSPFSLSQIGQSAESNPKPTSIFGASQFQQTQNSIFGATPSFGNQIVQPTKPSGLFSSANATLPTSNSMFGQNQNNAPTGLFGQSHSNQPAGSGGSLFGSSFGAPIQQPQQGLFGVAAENMFESGTNSSQSIFGANQQQSSNIFANAMAQQQTNTQNVFGISQPQQEQSNIFNKPNSNSTTSNIFQNQTSAPTTGTIFGGQREIVSQNAYSRLEDLSSENLEWFKSAAFEIGKIPTVPPPQELCM